MDALQPRLMHLARLALTICSMLSLLCASLLPSLSPLCLSRFLTCASLCQARSSVFFQELTLAVSSAFAHSSAWLASLVHPSHLPCLLTFSVLAVCV